MTVKTGSAWAGTFVTLDATGALAASADAAGTLYVDGVANAATVTITGSNPYKWSVTLPSLTAGQRVDMYITATIATVATAGIVASEQADTVRLSDGVVVNSGTVTNLTNLPTMPTDWVTAAGLKADAVSEIQSGLATSANLQTVDDNVDAIKAKTDNIPASPAAVGSAMTLSSSGVDAILDEVVVGTYTMRQLLKVMSAALAGKATGGGTSTITFRGVDDTTNVIVATVDTNGNRSSVTLTV